MCKGETKALHTTTMFVITEIISLSEDRTTLTVKGYPYGAPKGFIATYDITCEFWGDEDIAEIRERYKL